MSTMRPAPVNFRLYPHATFSEQVQIKDSNGEPIDLAGRTARMQVRRGSIHGELLFDLSSDAGELALTNDGYITITIDADHTAPSLSPPLDEYGEPWFYDMLVYNAGADRVERFLQGVIIVLPGVTVPPAAPTPPVP